ncbi:MAG: Concanavalin A-like lectin glucanase [Lasallia pustulata]|uniref:Concanavalin A-like lectin glucanase n=1 Tax=Lasallia pustulata TaxID=136370 RepID=A0A5M8PDB2_9LECA|nr:MAG: Concanavalin A-like lectin glucanase [Lasallia pustulata]
MIDNGSQGNTVTRAVIDELSLRTEPYGARGNAWGNVVDLSESVVLTIVAYDTAGQPYRYKSRFLVSRNDAPAAFVLGLPFLVHANPNHKYNTGKFLWRKGKHTKANQIFTPSERKALKGVVNMRNLSITDHFIGPADLVTDMENYAVHMNSLCAAEKQSLPERGPHNHAIDLEPGQQPPFGKLYSMSPAELDVLKVYLNDAIKAGIIRKSISPAASPVMFVPKSDGSLRLVIDYRRLNDITIKNRYPLPLISDMLDRLQGAKKFTKLDCKDAYNRVRIKGGDEWKTAFRTRFGLFEYLAMPFGLTNAPATFQAFIDKALGEFLDITCVVYLDDILIFSKNESDHEEHVRQVLAALRRYDLHLKISKCSFNTTEVDFLGFRINTEGIFMDPERIRAVEEWLPPQDIHQLQNKKEIGVKVRQTNVVPPPFPLSETALEAFKALKEAFTSAPLLRYFDENKPMRVETDASAFAIGGILTQQFEIDGHLHWLPVAYYSKKLLDTETRYGTGEQELFAIVEAMHHWRHYCRGARHPIVVLTDHANLVWFMTTPNLTRRQLKWAEKLAEYDFNVTYREGKKNPADGLSRRPDYKLPKASTTSTAAETVRQSFRLGSNDYKPVQEKLYDETTSYPTSIWTAVRLEHQQSVTYLLEKQAVMVMLRYNETTLYPTSIWTAVRLEHQQSVTYLLEKQAVMVMLRYDETTVVPNINMDGGTTGTPAVRNLSAREASRNGDAAVRRDNVVPNINMDGGTTGTPAVRNLSAREASRNGDAAVRRDNVVSNINMDGGTTGTPAVRNLSAREASRNGDAVVRRDNVVPNINMDGGTTGTPAVCDLYAREASRDADAMVRRDHVVPDIIMDVGRPGYPEAQHRSIEDSAADADAIDIDDTVDDNPIGLQIEAGASDETVEALWLVATRTQIGGEATAYTKMSIEELERAIHAKQSHDSLV